MIKHFLAWLLFTWAIAAVSLWSGKQVYDAELQAKTLDRHENLITAAQTMIREHLLVAVQDARLLAEQASTLGYPFANEEKIKNLFLDSSRIFGRYDQIRIISREGQERLRINATSVGPVYAHASELQNKHQRYYIQQGLTLDVGQVYLSPLDLNIEHGELERPFKPVIRLVSPIAQTNEEPGDLLVLNLRASAILNQFISLFPASDRAMLLNAEGYWMVNHFPQNEWGWMRNLPEQTVSTWNPHLWQIIEDTREGVTVVEDNLFSFSWMDIGNIYSKTSAARYLTNLGLVSDLSASQWIVLVQSAPEGWQEGAIYRKPWFQAALAGLFMLLAAIAYLASRNRQIAKEKTRLRQEQLKNFQDLYENAPIGYITLTQGGLITNINKQAIEYLGYSREELVGRKKLEDLAATNERNKTSSLMEQILKDEIRYFRIIMQSKTGDELVMSCSASSRVGKERTIELSRFSLQNVTEQARLEQKLLDLARKDPLTGIDNRRSFSEKADQELARSHRTGASLTAIALDIDFFKKINDSYGHNAGDEVLKTLAKHCRNALRRTDIFARFGGEEFVILLPDTPLEQGLQKAERLREMLAAAPTEITSGETIRFTASFGVAERAEQHQQIEDLLSAADQALYKAKRTGRNRVCTA
jgi:diguanylate cyclase (GGDEF)-like protein/PAS domain S-box-containing protein